MTQPQPCAECDLPEAVDAEPITTKTGEKWYCHGEVSPTCYEIAQRAFGTPGSPFYPTDCRDSPG